MTGPAGFIVTLRAGVFAALLCAPSLALAAPAAPALTAPSAELTTTTEERTTDLVGPVPLAYAGNGVIGEPNAAVETAVIVIHGDGRNARSYASSTEAAAALHGTIGSTLVVAPHFQAASDLQGNTMFWDEDGWKEGDNSLDASGLSSFEVVDRLLALLDEQTYPNLDRVVVTGHSAGGQFTSRWASGSTAANVDLVVPANAGSYMYLDGTRPYSYAQCSGWYNDYKYGLDNKNPYMLASTREEHRRQLAAKRVTYLLGTADVLRDASLDTSCAADAQGRNRLERGQKFFVEHLQSVYGPGIYATHRLVEIPGVGHTWGGTVKSEQGRNVIFGSAGEEPAPQPTEPPSFSDVPAGSQFYREITWLAAQGISTGYGDGTYRPLNPVNRDAMAAFLYRLAGQPPYTPPAVSPFSDVPAGSQFYREITWLAAQGISTGYGDGTYRPLNPVNRDAMAAFLYRLAGR